MASRIKRCGKVINCGPGSPTTLAEVFFVTKTTRRGSFLASELKPVSILFFSIAVLGLHGQTTVFLHAPEVNSDEQERNERENHHVKHVKTQQCVFPDDVTAQHQETNFTSDHRHGENNVGADGHGPECQLIPGQQIAGVTEKQRDQKKNDPDDPIEFVRRFVTAAVENMEHVPKDGEHHQMRGKAVKIAEKDAIRNNELQVFHVAVGLGSRGVVIKHQQDAGDEKNDEQKEGDRA